MRRNPTSTASHSVRGYDQIVTLLSRSLFQVTGTSRMRYPRARAIANASMSNPHPAMVTLRKISSAARSVNALNPLCVSHIPGTAHICIQRFPNLPNNTRQNGSPPPRMIEAPATERDPITTRYPCKKYGRILSKWRISVLLSASIKRRILPCADSIPRDTAAPLPRFGSEITEINGNLSFADMAICCVSSCDPLSTTITSALTPSLCIHVPTDSRVPPKRKDSLYAGIITDNSILV